MRAPAPWGSAGTYVGSQVLYYMGYCAGQMGGVGSGRSVDMGAKAYCDVWDGGRSWVCRWDSVMCGKRGEGGIMRGLSGVE